MPRQPNADISVVPPPLPLPTFLSIIANIDTNSDTGRALPVEGPCVQFFGFPVDKDDDLYRKVVDQEWTNVTPDVVEIKDLHKLYSLPNLEAVCDRLQHETHHNVRIFTIMEKTGPAKFDLRLRSMITLAILFLRQILQRSPTCRNARWRT
ncbi:hypothetical protein H0H81_006399 [Sphagnurus paluster]|uniref:Uncharacterized protein n=1 Tax=Sphagnurus paluster TaxID=117069 RepID=A0A9P7FXM8_9AGAR|nr:hypothetical protein H0H81_006399 [Sphagnurus paluster]